MNEWINKWSELIIHCCVTNTTNFKHHLTGFMGQDSRHSLIVLRCVPGSGTWGSLLSSCSCWQNSVLMTVGLRLLSITGYSRLLGDSPYFLGSWPSQRPSHNMTTSLKVLRRVSERGEVHLLRSFIWLNQCYPRWSSPWLTQNQLYLYLQNPFMFAIYVNLVKQK